MHQALRTDDILHEVFQHLGDVIPRRHALATSARVCKLFSEHALNALWNELETLLPVYKLLSAFESIPLTAELENDESDEWNICAYVLNGEISKAEWIRFHEYARRVRKICRCYGSTTESALLSLLFLQNNGKPLFPFLRHLDWDQPLPVDTSILALLSPSIQHLAIDFVGNQYDTGPPTNREYAFAMLLHAASSRCPMLDHLIIDGYVHPSSISTIAGWQHLRSIEINSTLLDHRLLRTLSTMASLVELNLTLFRPTDLDFNNHTGFHCLQKLTLCGDTAEIGEFISTISSSHLRHVSLCDMFPEVQPEDSRDLLTLLVSKFGVSLREISYSGGRLYQSQTNGNRSLLDVIGPLLGAHNLETIAIYMGFAVTFNVSDHDTETMATTWTKATSLSLEYWHGIVTPSLRSLHQFHRHCPLLNTLSLPFVEVEPLPTMESALSVTPHPLHYLKFGGFKPTIKDPCCMAQFLHRLFPKLSMKPLINHYYDGSGWEEVLKLLQTYHTVTVPSSDTHLAV